jgi:hypothetical protein
MKVSQTTKRAALQEDNRIGIPLQNRLLTKLLLAYCLTPHQWEVLPPTPQEIYDRLLTIISETCFDVSKTVSEAFDQVSIAFGFLAFDTFADWQKGAFLDRLRRIQEVEQLCAITLTTQETALLMLLCTQAHLACDPTRITFCFSEIEEKTPASIKNLLRKTTGA